MIIYNDNVPNFADRSSISTKLSIIPDSTTLANGVTESITKILSLASNLGVGLIQLLFIISEMILRNDKKMEKIEKFKS